MKKQARTARKRVRFELSTDPGSAVFVAGTFNNWDPTANALKDNPDSGHYKASLLLPPGEHQYKFVVDGAWTLDPNCSDCVPNECGSRNSVVTVQ